MTKNLKTRAKKMLNAKLLVEKISLSSRGSDKTGTATSQSSISATTTSTSTLIKQNLEDKYPEFKYSSIFQPFSSLCSEETKITLDKEEIKRQDRIYEFIFFEKMHVRRLRVIQIIFYETLRSHLPFVDFEEKIPAVELLISLHTKLIDLFNTEFAESLPNTPKNFNGPKNAKPIFNFGDVLSQWLMLNDGRNFKLFIEACKDFCKKQLSAGLWVQEQCKNNPELQYQLKEAESHYLAKKLPFANYLASQMQHLTKYPMLLESILAKTKFENTNSKEYEVIKKVSDKFREILLDVNSSVKLAQDQQKHEEIANNLDLSILRDYPEMEEICRTVIPKNLTHYGILRLQIPELESQSQNQNQNHQKLNNYDCLLFENVFVMTTMRAPRQYTLKPVKLKEQVIFPVMRITHEIIVTEDDSCDNFQFILQSSHPKQNLLLKCNLPHEKLEWIEALQKVIDLATSRISKVSNRNSGSFANISNRPSDLNLSNSNGNQVTSSFDDYSDNFGMDLQIDLDFESIMNKYKI